MAGDLVLLPALLLTRAGRVFLPWRRAAQVGVAGGAT